MLQTNLDFVSADLRPSVQFLLVFCNKLSSPDDELMNTFLSSTFGSEDEQTEKERECLCVCPAEEMFGKMSLDAWTHSLTDKQSNLVCVGVAWWIIASLWSNQSNTSTNRADPILKSLHLKKQYSSLTVLRWVWVYTNARVNIHFIQHVDMLTCILHVSKFKTVCLINNHIEIIVTFKEQTSFKYLLLAAFLSLCGPTHLNWM